MSVQPKQIFLNGERLTVISSENKNIYVEHYNVSNPTIPQLVKSSSYPFDLISSRRIDSKLYLVMNGEMSNPGLDYDIKINYDEWPKCDDKGKPKDESSKFLNAVNSVKNNDREIIQKLTVDKLYPRVNGNISCSAISRSPSTLGTNLLVIITEDLEDSTKKNSVSALLGNGGTVYASTNGLYVASVANYLGLSKSDVGPSTIVHHFEYKDQIPSYTGSAKVEGVLIGNTFAGSRTSERFSMNQFAMSEYENFFRIATNTMDENGSDNKVGVFSHRA